MKKRTNAELQSDIRDLRAQLREANAEHHAADLKARTLAIDLEHAVNAKDRLKRQLATAREQSARLQGRLDQIATVADIERGSEMVSVPRGTLPDHGVHRRSYSAEELRVGQETDRTHWTAE